jgi:hypothetical protein
MKRSRTRSQKELCTRNFNEVWVPSEFHLAAFTAAGTPPAALHRVPEVLAFAAWDPRAVTATKALFPTSSGVTFAFLFVGKWEVRNPHP